jgi:hypothetical protein
VVIVQIKNEILQNANSKLPTIKKAYIEKSGVQLTFAYLSQGCLAG